MNLTKEKLYTNLRIAHQEAELAALNKQSSIEAVMDHLLTELQELLTAHAGEKFAITIDGTFNKTEAYRMHDHQTRMTSFSRIFLGLIDDDPILISAAVSSLTGHHSQFPSQKLFEEVKPGVVNKLQERLYMMNLSLSGNGSWSLQNFLVAIAPEDIRSIVTPPEYLGSGTSVNVTLWIGNARFEEYLGTRGAFVQEALRDLFP